MINFFKAVKLLAKSQAITPKIATGHRKKQNTQDIAPNAQTMKRDSTSKPSGSSS